MSICYVVPRPAYKQQPKEPTTPPPVLRIGHYGDPAATPDEVLDVEHFNKTGELRWIPRSID